MADDSWMNKPPAYIDPEESLKAAEILKRPGGIPRDPQDVQDVPSTQSEALMPTPGRLDPEWFWVFPALAYTIVGLDKSIFELFSHALGQTVAVRTYQAQERIAEFGNRLVDNNPWFAVVQGIPREHSQAFIAFVESFIFRRQTPKPVEYTIVCKAERIGDPFVTGSTRTGVDICLLLPCASSGKRVVVRQQAGLQLRTPVLAIHSETIVKGEN